MTIQQAIERAIQGGWKERFNDSRWSESNNQTKVWNVDAILLDPKFWQALWKTMGWATFEEYPNSHCDGFGNPLQGFSWLVRMHRMIDAIADGKTLEEYIETL